MRLKYATKVIWIKEPRVKCILRVIKRYINSLFNREHIGGNPKTLSFEFIKYIWDFPKNNEQFIMQQMKDQYQMFSGSSMILKHYLYVFFKILIYVNIK